VLGTGEEGEQGGEGEGMLVPLLIGSRAQGAWPKVGCAAARPGAAGTRAGREPGMADTSAYRRTGGARSLGRLGGRFWAVSGQIWAKGLESKLLTTACSTFYI
jgi:hypothetical protein